MPLWLKFAVLVVLLWQLRTVVLMRRSRELHRQMIAKSVSDAMDTLRKYEAVLNRHD